LVGEEEGRRGNSGGAGGAVELAAEQAARGTAVSGDGGWGAEMRKKSVRRGRMFSSGEKIQEGFQKINVASSKSIRREYLHFLV
jgi:hypothetical protein